MKEKIIYVDFIFKRKKIKSKPLLLIYKIRYFCRYSLNNLFQYRFIKKENYDNESKIYTFKKVL